MTEHKTPHPIVIFRWLSMASLVAALIFRVFGRRVIYIEPLGRLRTPSWVKRMRRWGIEWVDYHAYAGLLPNADLVICGEYASALIEKSFTAADLDDLRQATPGLEGHQKRTQALLFNFLVRTLEGHSQAYALAEYFRTQGTCADIFQPRIATEALLAGDQISTVRNLFPRWGVTLLLRGFDVSLWRRIGGAVLARVLIKKGGQGNEQGLKVPSKPAEVLYFPHKGVSYGSLFDKDQYYMSDPKSPFHQDNIQHVELAWMMSESERQSVQADYDNRGLPVTFVDTVKQGRAEKIRTVFCRFQKAPGGARAIARAMLLSQLELRVKACRQAFAGLQRAKIALLGHDTLFPEAAIIALQSYGIKVVAVQERFMDAFHPFYAPIFDSYCVHGNIVKKQFENNVDAAIDEIVVTGDPRSEKIQGYLEKGREERDREFSGFSHVCLVLDFHSVRDPFQNAMGYGPDWKSNLFFYDVIATLAKTNPDCAFFIRGKNLEWQNIPDMLPAKQAFDALDNVFIDDRYDKFDRSYELAAMADLVVARYTSLCDQCLAEGIPALIFEGTPNGENVVLRWHDYAPYPIVVHQEQDLQARFNQVLRDGDFMPADQFKTMRQDYYDRNDDHDNGTPLIRLHRVLEDIYDRHHDAG